MDILTTIENSLFIMQNSIQDDYTKGYIDALQDLKNEIELNERLNIDDLMEYLERSYI